jgi:hypothetical protein
MIEREAFFGGVMYFSTIPQIKTVLLGYYPSPFHFEEDCINWIIQKEGKEIKRFNDDITAKLEYFEIVDSEG